jgi:hypothetical protein
MLRSRLSILSKESLSTGLPIHPAESPFEVAEDFDFVGDPDSGSVDGKDKLAVLHHEETA